MSTLLPGMLTRTKLPEMQYYVQCLMKRTVLAVAPVIMPAPDGQHRGYCGISSAS